MVQVSTRALIHIYLHSPDVLTYLSQILPLRRCAYYCLLLHDELEAVCTNSVGGALIRKRDWQRLGRLPSEFGPKPTSSDRIRSVGAGSCYALHPHTNHTQPIGPWSREKEVGSAMQERVSAVCDHILRSLLVPSGPCGPSGTCYATSQLTATYREGRLRIPRMSLSSLASHGRRP